MEGKKMSSAIDISIILCSNKINNFKNLIENIELTAVNLSSIELLIGCDAGENEFKEFCTNIDSKIVIKYHDIYEGDLYDQHKVMTKLINFSDEDSYFVLALADDMKFITKGWDKELLKYKHYYQDDIFRLRLGWRKFFSYTDFWQCASMPEDIDVCTRKWRTLVGEIPCFSIDSYNQTVMYYLENFDKFNNSFRAVRDIPIDSIKMKKHISQSIDDRLILKKMVKTWNVSVSHKIQELAKKSAAKIYCEIIKIEYGIEGSIKNVGKTYVVGDITVSYKISRLKILFYNTYRKIFYLEFGGGGFFKKISEKKLFSFRWLINVLFNYKSY